MQDSYFNSETNSNKKIREELLRYFSFWPYLLLLLLISILITFLYLRYTSFTYTINSAIEIIDEAQDSEMALPTELTVFNRSMINLENEINILNSFEINSRVVKNLKHNIQFYTVGNLKTTQVYSKNWYKDYQLDFKIDLSKIESLSYYTISTIDNKLLINSYNNNDDLISSNYFDSLSTLVKKHALPFELTIKSDENLENERILKFLPIEIVTNQIRGSMSVSEFGINSDQLAIKLIHENPEIGTEYLNGLMDEFNQDGINDRQLGYLRTIEFVDEREDILKKELEVIELRKQNFKKANNLSELSLDAGNNIDLKYTYNSEIFQAESQLTIADFLLSSLEQNDYDYLPINVGFDNFDINNMIIDYNKIISDRNKFLNEAGPNNILIKSLQSELDNMISNIKTSIKNFLNSTELKVKDLKAKELEFENVYSRVPENEKILRAIERELSIKEALYLLLLQKKEEASINLAVVKPSIKIIDYPITNYSSRSPNTGFVYLISILLPFITYITFLYIYFLLDNKIHNKDQLSNLLVDDIPIIAEIPFIKDIDSNKNNTRNNNSRSLISESIRMLLSNLRFTSIQKNNSADLSQTIIVTSSIKGEGKTLVSINTASSLANDLDQDKKVILLGTDLRNPQIHKSFGVEKNQKGISEIIYNNDEKNYKKYIQKFENLDVLFSGAIPPNPTAMLSSNIFKNLISLLKSDYDYIIIDSAPCLIVSDTFQFIDIADSIVYIFRSNFTDSKIVDFISETYNDKKIKNFNLVLNAVGNSAAYGYKYGYQYGYKYGYKYSYNYGYGYGYSADK
tara:strand:- start:460 stop:2859 length:2400 start_codon:yes stop_codon:yes gene_type:complete